MNQPPDATAFARTIILGAGVVGREIARAHLLAGLPVELTDTDAATLIATANSLAPLSQPPASPTPFDSALPRHGNSDIPLAGSLVALSPRADAKPIASVPTAAPPPNAETPHGCLVIESIVERLDVKQPIIAQLSQRLGPDDVLTSNTSSLRIADVMRDAASPANSCGMHFFMPVTERPLVEVVATAATSPATLNRIQFHTTRLGKNTLFASDTPGFLVNRLLWPYLNNAVRMLETGAKAPQIEQAALRFGMPMSPFELIDRIGMRTAFDAGRVAWQAFPTRIEPSPILPGLIKKKQLGRAAGAGFFTYQADERQSKNLSETAQQIVTKYQRETRSWDDQSAYLHLLIPMLIEATIVVDQQLAEGPAAIQQALVGGLGFSSTQNLFAQANDIGAETIIARIEQDATSYKALFASPETITSLKQRLAH